MTNFNKAEVSRGKKATIAIIILVTMISIYGVISLLFRLSKGKSIGSH